MKFSFIIIGHNQCDDICTAIDSVLNQKYQNIEAIYVDDASTDGTVELVKNKYSDERLRVIACEENQGPLIARMIGVEHCTGDWVLFLDGDDSYSIETCSVLAETINNSSKPIDMVGYGAEIIALENADKQSLIQLEEKIGTPCLGYLSGERLMEELYLKRTKSYSIWNKCYSKSVICAVAESLQWEKLFVSEDFYMIFVALSYVKTYFGIPDKLYHYTFGAGITTSRKLNFQAYLRYLTAKKAHDFTLEYAKKIAVFDKYQSMFELLDVDIICGTYYKLMQLPKEEHYDAARLFFDTYDTPKIIHALSAHHLYELNTVAEYLDIGRLFPYSGKKIQTVALYYHRLYNGGAERVIALLAEELKKIGISVVVITEEEQNEMDYPLPENTPHVVIGRLEDVGAQRYEKLTAFVRDYAVDAVIYNAWVAPSLFLDMLTIKSVGAACVVYCHGVYFSDVQEGFSVSKRVSNVFRYADGLVTLTELDRLYWSRYNSKVFKVNNPLSFDPVTVPKATLDSHDLVWIARLDPRKNPFDAVQVLQEVRKTVSDAKLYIVGGGNENLRDALTEFVKNNDMEDAVVFTGVTTDVAPFLLNSSVLLFLSDFESFGMVFAEALSYGVPIVAYELPYIEMIEQSEAAIKVSWKDTHAAAEAVVTLLTDDELRKRMGEIGKQEAIALSQINIGKQWTEILDAISNKNASIDFFPSDDLLEIYMRTHDIIFAQMICQMEMLRGELYSRGCWEGHWFDYSKMSRGKRWLTYLIHDHETLKSIVKYKNRSHPIRLKIYKKFWGLMRCIRRFFIPYF